MIVIPIFKSIPMIIGIGAETGVVRGGFTPHGFCQVGFSLPGQEPLPGGGIPSLTKETPG